MLHDKRLSALRGGVSVFGLGIGAAALLTGAAVAQDQGDDTVVQGLPDEDAQEIEEVIVTGSRIRRDEFTSAAPIQVLNTDAARQIGVNSIGELLQRSTVANGQQIDFTLNTNAGNSNASEEPPVGGVGSQNIDLRGLGPERTLLLMNGRRLGSAGVRGAPAQPDLSLLPFSIVERVEVITEGASSIYGADAVAGVVNVILRDDFEGLELSSNVEFPEAGGGQIKQFSFTMGTSTDRSNFMIAGEFFNRERVLAGQRDFTECLRSIEVAREDADEDVVPESGEFVACNSGFFDNLVFGLVPSSQQPLNPFTTDDPNDRLQELFFFYTPGETDIGVPNFSTFLGVPAPSSDQVSDPQNVGRRNFIDFFGDQDERRTSDLIQPLTRFSVVGTGKYTLDQDSNMEAYTEMYYFNRQLRNRATTEQIFPTIPGQIPQEDANGNIIVDPDTGEPILVDNPLNPFPSPAVPILTLEDIPQERNIELQQFRLVAGLTGDIAQGWFEENGWYYDVFFSYDRGVGFQDQPIFFEPHVTLATQTTRLDADGNVICGVESSTLFGFLTPPPCVPLNLFADSVFTGGSIGEGVFEDEAQRDYVLATRVNRTAVEQYMASGLVSGDLFDISGGGTVGVALGAEWRKDVIDSSNDITGIKGLNAAENNLQEGNTIGSRWIYDIYGEVNVPLVVDADWAKLLNVEGAARYTKEENFGSEVTVRARAIWQPNERVQISGSYGTSFRAPNLREQFLGNQGGGISGGNDPCIVPQVAFNNAGDYQRDLDPRSDTLLDNCRLSGADPTQLGRFAVVTIPTVVSGVENLVAEESRSFTGTVQVDLPTEEMGFDFDVAVSYYDIRITDTVEELAPATILSRCFGGEPNLASPFCERVERGSGAQPAANFLELVDASFVNIGLETARGIDINTRLQATLGDVGGNPLELAWATATAFALDQETQVFEDSRRDDNVGEIGTPEWQVTSTTSFSWGRWEFLWEARYLDGQAFDLQETSIDFRDSAIVPGTVETIPKFSTDARLYNDVSATYRFDRASLTVGVNNLTDTDPPLVDSRFPAQRNNAVTSSGFDLFGRTFFADLTIGF